MAHRSLPLFAAGALLLLTGCGGPPTGPDVDSLKVIADLYERYAATHQGNGPSSEDDLRAYLIELGRQEAVDTGKPVQTAEGLLPGASPPALVQDKKGRPGIPVRYAQHLTSTRDGQPFTILYGVKVSFKAKARQLVAYEAAGVNGKQLVVYANGEVDEVSPERLGELKAAPQG